MPTIPQLPVASSVTSTDELPVNQSGVTRAVSVGTLLGGAQPAILLPSGTLLGRASSGTGAAEPITLGTGLAMVNGGLIATGSEMGGFPTLAALTLADYAVVSHGGSPALLPLAALSGLFQAGANIAISNGTISASFPVASAGVPGAVMPGTGLALAAGGALSVVFGSASGTAAAGNDPRLAGALQSGNNLADLANAATARGNLGLGGLALQNPTSVAISGGSIGGADVSAATVATGAAGSKPRALAARFADAVNINDFGLARDGITDDSPKVAAAVAAAHGGRLYVPAGGPILLGGATQVVLQNIAILGDGVADMGYPYGHVGSQFWIRGAASLATAVDNPAGTTTLAVPGSTGIVAGMLVSSGATFARPTTVTAVSGNTVTLSTPTLADLPAGGLVWFANPLSPFALGSDVTIEGVNFLWPDQVDQPTAPIAYPPLFSAIPGSAQQVTNITFANVQVTNAYDFLTTGAFAPGNWTVVAGMTIRGCRICAINTCLTLPMVPDIVYISDTQFSYGVFEAEYLHYFGGGTKAQTSATATVATDAPTGSTAVTLTSASGIAAGMNVSGPGMPAGQSVASVAGNTLTLSLATIADCPAAATLTFVDQTYYLKSYTANFGTWLLVPGNGTASSVSTPSNDGIQGSNNYVFGPRYGVHVDGGNLALLRLANTGFDQVGTILLCENGGTTWDVQFSDFVAYGLIGTAPNQPVPLFSIQNPPPAGTGANARLTVTGMEVGFCSGTIFDIAGANMLDIAITNSKLVYYANTATPGPYYAARINAPNARFLFVGNDVTAETGGNTGVQIAAVTVATIAGNSFAGLAAPIDVETTAGTVMLGANTSINTTGPSSIIGTGAANVKDAGNGWDKPNLAYNAVETAWRANAVNGLQVNPGASGTGAALLAHGADANVQLYIGGQGTMPISVLTRQSIEQFRVADSIGATNFVVASGGTAALPATLGVGGTAADVGLAVSGMGSGATLLGSASSAVALLGAVAERAYSVQTPVSGAAITVPDTISLLQLNPPGTLASLAVTLPVHPVDGQVVAIATTQTITALVLSANPGQTLLGAPSTLAANSAVEFRFLGSTWFRKQ